MLSNTNSKEREESGRKSTNEGWPQRYEKRGSHHHKFWASLAQCCTTVNWTPDNSLVNRFRLRKRQVWLIFNGGDDETKVNCFVYWLSPTGIALTSGQVLV